MTSREYLEYAYRYSKSIRCEIDKANMIINASQKMTTTLSEIPIDCNRKNTMSDILPDIVDMKIKLSSEIKEYIKVIKKVCAVAELISDPRQRIIIKLRYCEALGWREISKVIGYSLSRTYVLRDTALNEFGAIFEKESSKK